MTFTGHALYLQCKPKGTTPTPTERNPMTTKAKNIIDGQPIEAINKPDIYAFPTTGTLVTIISFAQPQQFISSIPLHNIISTLIQGMESRRVWSTNLLRYFLTTGMTCPLTVDPSELTIPEIRIECNEHKMYWSHDNWVTGEGRTRDASKSNWLYHSLKDYKPLTKGNKV